MRRTSSGIALVTLRPSPAATQARLSPCQRASHRMPPSFRSRTIRSLGHLSATGSPGAAASSAVATSRPSRRLRSSTPAGAGGRYSTLSQSPPGGECQARPRDPRPPVWASARTAVPAGAPCSASWCSRSMVEPIRPTRCSSAATQRTNSSSSAPNTMRYQANDREAVARHVGQKTLHHHQGREERDHEPDRERGRVRRGERVESS